MDDWATILSLGSGYVALMDGQVVGAMCMTSFGEVAATSLLIVDDKMRGRGLGDNLMNLALEVSGGRECRLISTTAGLHLYRKLGFREIETIHAHQGTVSPIQAADGIEWTTRDDFNQICDIDRSATGIERRTLMSALWETGRYAVIRDSGQIVGYSALFWYGRGENAGPVIGRNTDEARRLLSFLFSHLLAHSFASTSVSRRGSQIG
ncbi:GNAT family N-acetyltransferase [Bradyrhizobium arachidis]|uniref:GNAT family N-acetyltransferase n=1 Tax=Bradyrhizobium arachidis TaxID=858423 RepID=UPI0021636F5A|nr:GNAT family N-acetyltransferase [Bradyrhizobium arachidis]UVO35783.1 GNAT family N-acetyltransferase [Bradyrhizobium arachidis]